MTEHSGWVLDKRSANAIAIGAGLFALAWFLAHAAYVPYPGRWATALASYAGLDPFRPISQPIWGFLMSGVAKLGFVPFAAAANALSAIFCAAVVGLVTATMLRIPFAGLRSDPAMGLENDSLPRVVAALTAALFLTAVQPMQVLASHANPLPLGVLFLAGAWLLAVTYSRTSRLAFLMGSALLLGVGASEFTALLFFIPVFALWMLWALWRRKQLGVPPVVGLTLCGLSGVVVMLVAVMTYAGSPVAEWREFKGFFEVFRFFLIEQHASALRAIPKHGWLVVFLVAALPLPFVFSRGFEDQHDLFTEIGWWALRLVLLPLAAIVLFELPGSPTRITGAAVPLLTPYVLVAVWAGRYAGFLAAWLAFPRARNAGSAVTVHRGRRAAATVWVALVLAACSAALVRHREAADVDAAVGIHRIASAILDASASASWLLTDGVIDPVIQLEAREQQLPLRVINLASTQQKPYLRFLGSAYGIADAEWMSTVGFDAVFLPWLRSLPDPRTALAAITAPGHFVNLGLDAFAAGPVFRPAQREEYASRRDELDRGLQTLRTVAPPFAATTNPPTRLNAYLDWGRRFCGRMANNIGVGLEIAGDTNAAMAAYHAALDMHPDNVSAKMNLYAIGARAGAPDTELREQIESAVAHLPEGIRGWAISNIDGFINHPAVLLQEGFLWAATGRSGAGLRRMERALEQGATGRDAQLALSRLYAAEQQRDRTREILDRLIEANPKDVTVLMERARLNGLDGRFTDTRSDLDAIEAVVGASPALALERAKLLVAEGKLAEAAEAFRALTELTPDDPAAWLGLVFAHDRGGNLDAWRTALEGLNRTTTTYIPGLLYLADAALANNDINRARQYLDRARQVRPALVPVLERRAALEFGLRNNDAIEAAARELLAADPENGLGHYMLGTVFVRKDRLDLAREALRKSVITRPTPAAYNDLAWVSHRLREGPAALEYAMQACQMDPESPILWGTRGKIEFDLGLYEEAIESFLRQAQLGTESIDAQLLVAEAHLELGRSATARRILTDLNARQPMMTDQQRRDFQRLSSAL